MDLQEAVMLPAGTILTPTAEIACTRLIVDELGPNREGDYTLAAGTDVKLAGIVGGRVRAQVVEREDNGKHIGLFIPIDAIGQLSQSA